MMSSGQGRYQVQNMCPAIWVADRRSGLGLCQTEQEFTVRPIISGAIEGPALGSSCAVSRQIIGPHFFLVGRQEVELWLQNSQYGGLAGEVCEGRGLKTEAQVKFSAERMAVPMGSICLDIYIT